MARLPLQSYHNADTTLLHSDDELSIRTKIKQNTEHKTKNKIKTKQKTKQNKHKKTNKQNLCLVQSYWTRILQTGQVEFTWSKAWCSTFELYRQEVFLFFFCFVLVFFTCPDKTKRKSYFAFKHSYFYTSTPPLIYHNIRISSPCRCTAHRFHTLTITPRHYLAKPSCKC